MGDAMSLLPGCGHTPIFPLRKKLLGIDREELGDRPEDLPVVLLSSHRSSPCGAITAFFWVMCVLRWNELTAMDGGATISGTFDELRHHLERGDQYIAQWKTEEGLHALQKFFAVEHCAFHVTGDDTWTTAQNMALPIIDLTSPTVVVDVKKVCLESGFFYVKNHGVGDDLVREMFKMSKAFFDLPMEEKKKVEACEATKNKGYTGMGEEKLDLEYQNGGDTKEGYYLGREPGEEEKGVEMMGENVWPEEGVVPGWRDVMERYIEEMTEAGMKVVRVIAGGLGVDVEKFMECFRLPVATLRLLHYDNTKSNIPEGVYGAGAHTDYGMITLLAVADSSPGLEVDLNGTWTPIPPIPSTFIVNLGDLLQRWTNNAYRSTRHRVINASGDERYSTAFFFDPAYPTEVTCLPSFSSDENPPKFPPIRFLDHLLQKYDQTHAGFNSKKL